MSGGKKPKTTKTKRSEFCAPARTDLTERKKDITALFHIGMMLERNGDDLAGYSNQYGAQSFGHNLGLTTVLRTDLEIRFSQIGDLKWGLTQKRI